MRRLSLVVLLALSVALAGCARPSAEVEPAAVPPADEGVALVARPEAPMPASPPDAALPAAAPPTRLPFRAPVELPLVNELGGGEPNIAALPDGTLFVAAPTGAAPPNAMRGGGYLWRSTDDGASWEMLRGPEGERATMLFCSCDSDVVTSPDGWVYYSDWWIAGVAGNYLVERSSDGGETWTASPITTREALAARVDRQWLVAGEDGFVGLFYSYFATPLVTLPGLAPDLTRGIHAVFSEDHGETWSDPVVVLGEGSWQIAHPRILPDGTLVAPYGLVDVEDDFWRDPSLVMLAVSTDGGRTWTHKEVAKAPEGFDNLWAVQADVDGAGRVHVAWSARVDDDIMATYVATSSDAGDTWSAPLGLRAQGLNFLPWVAAHGNDTVAVGWYGGNATGDPTKADAPWFAYVAQSTDGGASFVVHTVTDAPVKEGALCPKGASCRGDRELLDYVSLVYDAEGDLHYAFARSDGDVAQTLVASVVREAVP